MFLEYLYSGCINIKELSVDQIAELMMLSDRYEVDTLKQVCEQVLKRHIDGDSVLYFLSLADQFNARVLKVCVPCWFFIVRLVSCISQRLHWSLVFVFVQDACMTYASHHPGIMDHDLFEELPQSLQSEIYDLIIWVKPS